MILRLFERIYGVIRHQKRLHILCGQQRGGKSNLLQTPQERNTIVLKKNEE